MIYSQNQDTGTTYCCSNLQVYIQFMKFARRSESIKESRMVFKRAREDTRTDFHVGVVRSFYLT